MKKSTTNQTTPNPCPLPIGQVIFERLVVEGITVWHFAEQIGIPQGELMDILTGERALEPFHANAIGLVLGIDPQTLLDWDKSFCDMLNNYVEIIVDTGMIKAEDTVIYDTGYGNGVREGAKLIMRLLLPRKQPVKIVPVINTNLKP